MNWISCHLSSWYAIPVSWLGPMGNGCLCVCFCVFPTRLSKVLPQVLCVYSLLSLSVRLAPPLLPARMHCWTCACMSDLCWVQSHPKLCCSCITCRGTEMFIWRTASYIWHVSYAGVSGRVLSWNAARIVNFRDTLLCKRISLSY